MTYEGLMVSVSGVRGRVGAGLTPEVVARFAAGFGAWATARHAARGGAAWSWWGATAACRGRSSTAWW
jgi:phosphomannomutase